MPAATFSRPGPLQRPHERLGGEAQIAVLFHVEIDEFRQCAAVRAHEHLPRGRAVEQFQPLAKRGHRLLAGQRRNLRVERRNLDRNHLDVGRLEGLQVGLQPLIGLVLAENGLAQEVHVHADALGVPPAEVLQEQIRLGGQDDVGRLLPHLVLDQRHSHARHVAAERLKALQQRPLEGAEKAGDSLHVEDVDELVNCAV